MIPGDSSEVGSQEPKVFFKLKCQGLVQTQMQTLQFIFPSIQGSLLSLQLKENMFQREPLILLAHTRGDLGGQNLSVSPANNGKGRDFLASSVKES